MPKPLGFVVYPNAIIDTGEAGEALSPGDAVGLSGGQYVKADGTNDTNALGIVTDNSGGADEAGDSVGVCLSGAVVANVAGGVTAGGELDVSATEGQLAAGTGGIDALSDEGGTWKGAALAANAAVVHK
ncbi:hypothetical protein [Halomarina oriensis]|uniref:DUF2190 family protein n=1 Tax=Halomarina oriensis TaxID=671145 RepID=A0A6B0GT06_9EURY|nr:hypothetical protein [Halomarina oriensis]MWG34828.1 hypothetical protein [Halomarina oriensis]